MRIGLKKTNKYNLRYKINAGKFKIVFSICIITAKNIHLI